MRSDVPVDRETEDGVEEPGLVNASAALSHSINIRLRLECQSDLCFRDLLLRDLGI